MQTYRETLKDTTATMNGKTLAVPKGTELKYIHSAGDCSGYAVKDPTPLGFCFYDSQNYYAYVPSEKVVFEAIFLHGPLKIKSDNWQETANAWRINIAGQSFEYYTGTGIKKAPDYDSVLYSLVTDAEALKMSFENWANEFGYNDDSIKAKKIWRACCENARKLIATGVDIDAERERLRDF